MAQSKYQKCMADNTKAIAVVAVVALAYLIGYISNTYAGRWWATTTEVFAWFGLFFSVICVVV
jgi:hypothetical protein